MVRELPLLGATNAALSASARTRHVRLGIWIALATILWMTVEAVVAISIGFLTQSVSPGLWSR